MRIPAITKWSHYGYLLGAVPDAELAELVGITPNAVTQKRIRAGIPAMRSNKEKELETQFCETLTESFERQVRTAWGIVDILTPSSIYECKTVLTTGRMHGAVGQLVCYARAYPGRKLYIVCREIKTTPELVGAAEGIGVEIVVMPKR